ncbi:Retrotransposon gag protein [Gossypium australe]|uniref:Retrotransposon gag protein n=1 Tax=Gossypium australe TaxID=47621 RepID=A0A5B6V9H6_9ROSI|nr:Retrotransposon gag protein [Gossypium australe]
MVVIPNRKDWSSRFHKAIWTPLGMSPFKLIYRKPYHLPVELKHKTYWAIKKLNTDWHAIGTHCLLELNEMENFQAQAYENDKLYKEKIKQWHDNKILPREFVLGQHVLLFNSRLKLFLGKLKSR